MIKILQKSEDINAFLNKLYKRADTDDDKTRLVEETVKAIIKDVKTRGDEAVKEYTAKFDCPEPLYYKVPVFEIDKAFENADKSFIEALKRCHDNISKFHEKQIRTGYKIAEKDGETEEIIIGQRLRALNTAGLYAPGGTAAYPSTILMNAIPAKLAGVKRIIIATPPRKDGTPNPDILAAAKLCGVEEIFLCGGAQAISALAYGTETIPKVDKVVGPGNIYVNVAKELLFGTIDIDMFAGPSEILIIADKSANPAYIAADLLSQAEHDALASSVLITDSLETAEKTSKELEKQLSALERKDIAKSAITDYSAAIIVSDMEEAVKLANEIAPEHCEVLAENPLSYIEKIDDVGSLFLGEYAPEPLGDYYAGPNHVLPTNFTARFFSPLSVDAFYKKSSYIYYSEKALKNAANDITLIAEREGLTAHANAIKIRME